MSLLVLLCMFSSGSLGGEFDCLLEPRQVLELRSPIEGLIDRINVDRGDYVKKGQELALLDIGVDRLQASMAQLRSQMEGAVGAWQSRGELSARKSSRFEELHRSSMATTQMRDEAAAEKRIAEAELQDAMDNRKLAELEHKRQLEIIRLKTIRSPINGVITERLQNPGELAESGVGRKPMLKMADIDVLNVEVLLPAEAYGKIRTGMSAFVTPEIPPGTRLRATVKVVDPVLDAASRTLGVRLELGNPQRKIPGGSHCRVEFPDVSDAATVKRHKTSPAKP